MEKKRKDGFSLKGQTENDLEQVQMVGRFSSA